MRSQIVAVLAGGALVVGAAAGMALAGPDDGPDAGQPDTEPVAASAADPGDRGRDRAPGQLAKESGERPGDRDDEAEDDTDDESGEGPRGAGNRESARAFVSAKKEWTACVGEEAAAHEGPGRFDPEEACGDKPRPAHAGPHSD